EMRIGKKVGKILSDNKEKTPEEFKTIFSESKCDELFNEEWLEVKKDQDAFLRTMTKEIKSLEQHVVNSFNEAIINGCGITNNNRDDAKEKQKFDKIFWKKLLKPATLIRSSFLDQFVDNVKVKIKWYNRYDNSSDEFKKTVVNRIKAKIEETSAQICNELRSRNALAIEFNQPLDWLRKLCDNIYNVITDFSRFTIEINDYSSIEQYLRLQVFDTLVYNTERWNRSQQDNLEKLCVDLLKCFHDILSNSSYENIATQLFRYVSQSVEITLVIQQQLIREVLKEYSKNHWMSEDRNFTRYAYERSFGTYNVEKSRDYINNPILFMTKLFNEEIDLIKNAKIKRRLEEIKKAMDDALRELGEIISDWQQRVPTTTLYENFTLEEIFQKTEIRNDAEPSSFESYKKISAENLIEDAIRILGKCAISSPQDFYDILKEEYNKYVTEFQNSWKEKGADDCRKSMVMEVENFKLSYSDEIIGCRHICPSKCELPEHEINTNHRASFHLMGCFTGVQAHKTNNAYLLICNEPDNYLYHYIGQNDEELLFEEYTKKYYPEWWQLLERKNPDEDQIMQVRAIWMHLKTELCSKFKMVDSTPKHWHRNYYHLAESEH
ncbi:18765_t:CDS:2, partial [Acaulospora morrowiae]